MAILLDTDRKSVRARVTVGLVYLALVIGGFAMAYPFALMVSSASTDEVDYTEYRLIPAYLYNVDALYTKFVSLKHIGWWDGARRPFLFAYGLSANNYNQDFTSRRGASCFLVAMTGHLGRRGKSAYHTTSEARASMVAEIRAKLRLALPNAAEARTK